MLKFLTKNKSVFELTEYIALSHLFNNYKKKKKEKKKKKNE